MLVEINEEVRRKNLGSIHMGKSRKGSLLGLNSLCPAPLLRTYLQHIPDEAVLPKEQMIVG